MTKGMQNHLLRIVKGFKKYSQQDMISRWNKLDIQIERKEVYEVLTGILARQITLAIQFADNFNCWTYDIAPMILRSMTDNYINFAWIAKDPDLRAKQFISYGLGQEKLQVEHLKVEVEKMGPSPEGEMMIKVREAWLDSQRYSFLTEVNIGSWSGISTRKMAEEADSLDFYNSVYTPFSSAVHNMWNHIARFNLEESDNPLHRKLKVPVINSDMNIDLHNIVLAAKYTDKMIKLFDKVFSIKIKRESTYNKIYSQFLTFENKYRVSSK